MDTIKGTFLEKICVNAFSQYSTIHSQCYFKQPQLAFSDDSRLTWHRLNSMFIIPSALLKVTSRRLATVARQSRTPLTLLYKTYLLYYTMQDTRRVTWRDKLMTESPLRSFFPVPYSPPSFFKLYLLSCRSLRIKLAIGGRLPHTGYCSQRRDVHF